MRRASSVALALAGAIAAVLVGSCTDSPVEPTRSTTAPAHMPVSLATSSTTASGATFTTDKDDYFPGDTLRLAGTGWQPGDSLDIHLDEDPQNHPPLDWIVGVDENGQFRDSSYIVQDSDLGVTFALTATSRATGESATATFTDAGVSASVAAIVGSVPPGSPASYTVTVNFTGNQTNCTTALSVTTALPTGASASFNPASVTGNNSLGNTPKTSTLTISTTAATPAGTYPFTVSASASATGCAGNASTANGTLIVFGPATHIAFGLQPGNTAATATITPAVTVQVLDAGNRVVANSSALVSLTFGNNAGGGTLTGGSAVPAVNGIATFSALSIDKIGTGYTLKASSAPFSDVTSGAFDITPGPAAQVVFSTQPGGATANTAFTTQPVVDVLDAGGNRITTGVGSGTTITLSIVSGTGTASAQLTCTNLAVLASQGRSSYAGCKIDLAGTGYKLRATTGNLGGGIGTLIGDSDPFDVAPAVVPGPTKLAFTTTAFTGVVGECIGAITVQTQNASNVATNVTSNTAVSLSTDGTGSFYSNNTCTTALASNTFTITSGNNSGSFYYKPTARGDGTHELTASASSLTSASQTETINQAATTTTIGSVSPGSPFFGQQITVNYSVSVDAPGSGTPTGNVTVKDGSTTLCSGTVAAGNCMFYPAGGGNLSLTATYAGDANFATSTSAPATPLTVDPAPTTTTITSVSPSPSTFGQQVTVAFSVAPTNTGGSYNYQSLSPTGNVAVKNGSTTLCNATVATGSCQFYPTGAGSLNLTATYAGDANFATSTSSPATSLTVNRAPTTTSVGTISPSSPFFGQQITVNFSVAPTNAGPGYNYGSVVPTGTVQVKDGTTLLCSASVATGNCKFYPAGAGTLSLKAYYLGDAASYPGDGENADDNFLASSTASPTSLTVDRAPTTTSITSPADGTTFVVNQTVTVNFSVGPEYTGAGYNYGSVVPTGTVQVKNGTTLLCSGSLSSASGSCDFVASSAGNYTLKAYYLGAAAAYPGDDQPADDNFLASQSSGVGINAAYRFIGLAAPVDRPNTMNLSKAGQAIPLKWQLLDFFYNPVTTLTSVTVLAKDLSCSLGTSTDQVEEYASGASGLQNLGGGYYQFNWKTPSSYAMSCKNLVMDLGEGTKRDNLAYFTFKK